MQHDILVRRQGQTAKIVRPAIAHLKIQVEAAKTKRKVTLLEKTLIEPEQLPMLQQEKQETPNKTDL